jgi:hypothetical protein
MPWTNGWQGEWAPGDLVCYEKGGTKFFISHLLHQWGKEVLGPYVTLNASFDKDESGFLFWGQLILVEPGPNRVKPIPLNHIGLQD